VSQKGKRHTLVFENDPHTRTLRFAQRGGRAEASALITCRAGPRPGETIVRARLYAHVHGPAALLVTDAKVRAKRQKKVMSDLTRVLTYFGPPGARAANAR
jgi:hypothetical protein